MAEYRQQEILDHISGIDYLIDLNESCSMNLQKDMLDHFSYILELDSPEKSLDRESAKYEKSLVRVSAKYEKTFKTYLENIEELKSLRANWLNSL